MPWEWAQKSKGLLPSCPTKMDSYMPDILFTLECTKCVLKIGDTINNPLPWSDYMKLVSILNLCKRLPIRMVYHRCCIEPLGSQQAFEDFHNDLSTSTPVPCQVLELENVKALDMIVSLCTDSKWFLVYWWTKRVEPPEVISRGQWQKRESFVIRSHSNLLSLLFYLQNVKALAWTYRGGGSSCKHCDRFANFSLPIQITLFIVILGWIPFGQSLVRLQSYLDSFQLLDCKKVNKIGSFATYKLDPHPTWLFCIAGPENMDSKVISGISGISGDYLG